MGGWGVRAPTYSAVSVSDIRTVTYTPSCKAIFDCPKLGNVPCSSVVGAFAHGAMGRRIDPSWWTH